MQIGGVGERFDGQLAVFAQAADGAAEGSVGGCSGGCGCACALGNVGHLSGDLTEADGCAGGEDEPVGGAVDESGGVESVDRVDRVDVVAALADDLLKGPGSLVAGVDQEVEDGPLGLGLLVDIVRDTLRLRHGR